MSVVATVKVYDGIVLGAESMTQITSSVAGQPQLVKAYEHAQKLFQIGNLGILTYGIGNIGRRSIESYVHQFSRSRQEGASQDVEVVGEEFFAFMQKHHADAFGTLPIDQQPGLGFVVAGYSTDENKHLASEWEFILPFNTEPVAMRPQDEIGASWRGVQDPFIRLMLGYDPNLPEMLLKSGMPPNEVERFGSVVKRFGTMIVFDGMPLQDAVGYCRFIIQTTIGWCTYAAGQPSCGGPIKLATITPGDGFKWVTPPKAYLQGEKHDHQ